MIMVRMERTRETKNKMKIRLVFQKEAGVNSVKVIEATTDQQIPDGMMLVAYETVDCDDCDCHNDKSEIKPEQPKSKKPSKPKPAKEPVDEVVDEVVESDETDKVISEKELAKVKKAIQGFIAKKVLSPPDVPDVVAKVTKSKTKLKDCTTEEAEKVLEHIADMA